MHFYLLNIVNAMENLPGSSLNNSQSNPDYNPIFDNSMIDHDDNSYDIINRRSGDEEIRSSN